MADQSPKRRDMLENDSGMVSDDGLKCKFSLTDCGFRTCWNEPASLSDQRHGHPDGRCSGFCKSTQRTNTWSK